MYLRLYFFSGVKLVSWTLANASDLTVWLTNTYIYKIYSSFKTFDMVKAIRLEKACLFFKDTILVVD